MSTSWSNPSNWSTGAVPGPTTDVIIAPALNQPSTYSAAPVCADLTLLPLSSLTLASGFDLDVRGNLLILGSLTVTSSLSKVLVAGGFVNDSLFSCGGASVELTGAGLLGGLGPILFEDLVISGGVRSATADFTANGDVTVKATGKLDLPAGVEARVRGDWTSSAAGAATTGAGGVELEGTGSLSTGLNGLPNLTVLSGARTIASSKVTGDFAVLGGLVTVLDGAAVQVLDDLDLAAGELRIADAAALSVGGDALLQRGVLSFGDATAASEILDVQGKVSAVGTSAGAFSQGAQINCAGDWVSGGGFAPAQGTVRFDGGTAATLSGAPATFHTVQITSGVKTFAVPVALSGDLQVASGATLLSSAALDVAGSASLGGAGSAWDLGGLTHRVGAGLASTGGSIVDGVLELDGPGGAVSSGAGLFPSLRVLSGPHTFGTTSITGELELQGGAVALDSGAQVGVGGSALLAGGTLGLGPAARLTIANDVTCAGTAATAIAPAARIEFGGTWTAAPSWSPLAGITAYTGGPGGLLVGTATLASLSVESGDLAVANALSLSGSLTLSAPLASVAPLTVAGNVSLGAAGSWNLGGGTHDVTGDWTSLGGSALNGTVRFTGTGTVATGVSGSLPNVRITAGTRRAQTSVITGQLTLLGGTLEVQNDQVLTVQGTASLTGGALSFSNTGGGFEVLDLANAVLGATAGTMDASSLILCSGNWTSTGAWSPPAGSVILDGGTSATVGGASPTFHDLIVLAGQKTALSPLAVGGNLGVFGGQSLTAQAPLTVGGSVALLPGSTLNAGLSTHVVQRDWISSGALVADSATIELAGDGALSTGASTLPYVRVTGGTRVVATSAVRFDLQLTGGTLLIQDGALLSVGGDMSATGGTLAFAASGPATEILDVDGSFTASGAAAGSMSPEALMRCGGNWTSNAAFAPAAGTVVLDGPGAGTVGGSGLSLPGLKIAAGAKTCSSSALLKSLEIVSGASLYTQAALDVSGGVVLGDATATLNLGALTHQVAGSYVSAGANALNGTLELDGSGTLDTGAGSIANVRITAGTRVARTSTVQGSLAQTGGALVVDADQTLSVGGNASLTAGTLGFFATAAGAPEVLDIEGDAVVTLAAGTSSAGAVIRCAGDWSSSSAFNLAAGTVELDGAAPSTLGGVAPGFDPTFPVLSVKNGLRSAAGDLALSAGEVRIAAGAGLDLGSFSVDVPHGLVTVDGALAVGAGGALGLGGTTAVLVSATGTLTVRGTFAEPAVVHGLAGGGYLLAINGTLDALDFRFGGMGANGIAIAQSATVAELRAGLFTDPWPASGALLLDISRPAPSVFAYVDFADAPPADAKNVRTLGGAPITFMNSEGNLAGPAFEIDPFGLVAWQTSTSSVTAFEATAGPDVVDLAWTTSLEVDTAAWVVERATALAGPYAALGELTATGPGLYGVADTVVVPKQHYFYRLMEKKTHGELVQQAKSDATPWSTGLPANVLAVGPGAFPDVQSAISAASGPSAVIAVAPGTYPSFTINGGAPGTLRIYGAGAVQIDTSGGPVTIQNLGVASSVELSDLTIGSASSPNTGLVVQSCAGIVILDELAVHGGAGQPGLRASAALRLAVQRSAIDGSPGSAVDQGSQVLFGNGALDELALSGASSARLAGVSPATTVDPTSTLTVLPGAHADLGAPEFIHLGSTFSLSYAGEPGSLYAVAYSTSLAWFDLPSPFEMVALLNLAQTPVLTTGVLAATPIQQTLPVPADGVLFGAALPAQMAVINPTTLKVRWSNVVTLVGID